ncbi:hypothetical protein CEXT_211191 [Caerostris extrusa]|uniref:Uncharacterized protein n=1 Tax=Caerostris extrusa TaxID=172846 RepID=A0AAV4NF29_CAEEX|nr:hypothetical protein CEXT_211191 [Caerostris extrusa]
MYDSGLLALTSMEEASLFFGAIAMQNKYSQKVTSGGLQLKGITLVGSSIRVRREFAHRACLESQLGFCLASTLFDDMPFLDGSKKIKTEWKDLCFDGTCDAI